MKTWMANAANKLHSQAGESIGETLASLLIAALALTMLAGAVAAGTHVVTRSRDNLNSYYEAANSVAQMSGSSTSGTVTLTDGSLTGTVDGTAITGGLFTQEQSVQLYRSSESIGGTPVAAYRVPPVSQP